MSAKIGDLHPALKAVFSCVVIQFALFFVILIPSIILMQALEYGTYTRGDQELNSYVSNNNMNLRMFGKLALPATLFTAVISILGIIAVLYWQNRIPAFRLIIAYVVLQLVALAYSITIGGVLVTAMGPRFCNEIKSSCEGCSWDTTDCCFMTYASYELYCFAKQASFQIVTYFLLINGAVSLAALICGSVGAKVIKLSPKHV